MNITEGLILRTGVTRKYLEEELELSSGEIYTWFDEDDHRGMLVLIELQSIQEFVKFCVNRRDEKQDKILWHREDQLNLGAILSILTGRRKIPIKSILDKLNKIGLVVTEDDLVWPHKIINKLNVPEAFANKEKLVIDFLKRSFPWE